MNHMQRNDSGHERLTVAPLLLLLLLLPGMFAGCGRTSSAEEARLTHGAPSLEELGAQVWSAIVRGDTTALERLRLSEYEHNELVWPEQPAAREPTAAAQLPFWWRNIQVRNRAAVDRLLRSHRGSSLEFGGVICAGEPRRYPSFRALTDCHLLVRAEGRERALVAFRHVIRMDGVYKVVRYYGD